MLIRIASIRPTQHTFILKKIEKISLVCLLTRRFEQPMTQEYSSYFTDAGIKNDRAIKGHNLKKLWQAWVGIAKYMYYISMQLVKCPTCYWEGI